MRHILRLRQPIQRDHLLHNAYYRPNLASNGSVDAISDDALGTGAPTISFLAVGIWRPDKAIHDLLIILRSSRTAFRVARLSRPELGGNWWLAIANFVAHVRTPISVGSP